MLADVSASANLVADIFVAMASLLAVIGGIIGVLRYQRTAGARDARDDRMAEIVFGKEGEPDMRQAVTAFTEKLDIVYTNMLPNGGKSMRDDIAAIRTQNVTTNNAVQQLIGEVRGLRHEQST